MVKEEIKVKDPKATIMAGDTQPGRLYFKNQCIVRVLEVKPDSVRVQTAAPSVTNEFTIPLDYGFHGELSNGSLQEFISKLPTYLQTFYNGGSEEMKEKKKTRREERKRMKRERKERQSIKIIDGKEEPAEVKEKPAKEEEPTKTPHEVVRNKDGETVSSLITGLIKEGKSTREEIAKAVKKAFSDISESKINGRINLKMYKLGAKEVNGKLKI